jgi:MoaA/NifB/PqqE/SkfB family radical SAM enzyme
MQLGRIARFFYHRRGELLSPAYWRTLWRVARARFNFWERVCRAEAERNFGAIEQRPWNLHIELTNICNSNCIFCAYQHQTRPRLVMSDEVFRKALDDYCDIGGGDLHLQVTVGDPAVDPKLIDRIHEARARPEIAAVQTISNAVALTERTIPGLVRSGLTRILISSGPWDRELYQRIYRNGAYDRVKRNVRLLLEENARATRPMEICIAFRSNLPMQQTLRLPDYAEIAHLPHQVEFNTDFDTWTGEIKASDLLPGMHLRPPTQPQREPCYMLCDGPIVYSDGRVGICSCRDFNASSELIVGRIQESALIDLWRSSAVQKLRERFRSGDFPAICLKCTTYSNLHLYRTRVGSERAVKTLERLTGSAFFARTSNGARQAHATTPSG